MMELVCAACLAFGQIEGEKATNAETIYNGNALCYAHFETGFSIQPVLQHKPDKGE